MTIEISAPSPLLGIHHDIPASRYHADDFGPIPTLSSSIAKIILDEAPIKAFIAHPRFGEPLEDAEPTRPKEVGTAAHKLILGRGGEVVEIDAVDYKTAAARTKRTEAYAEGKCPILAPDLVRAQEMGNAVRSSIARRPECKGFLEAVPEVVVIARDPSGAVLRIMIDKLEIHDGRAVIWDLKTGEQSAAPHTLGRRIESMGMELQASFYERVLALARPDLAGRITHRWLFVENDAPHLSVPAEMDATGREMGRRKAAYAIAIWNRCLAQGEWPGYPPGIVVAEYPSYAETKWMAREDAYTAQGIDGLVDAPAIERPFRSLAGAC